MTVREGDEVFDPRLHGDRGAVLPVFALFLVALLSVTALVVDLGMDRATIRRLKLETDAAAVAAGFFLSGQGSEATVSNPAMACSAAVTSVQRDLNDFPATATMTPSCSSLPSDAAHCVDGQSASKTITSGAAGPYILTIQYPVYANAIVDLARKNGVGADDGTNACDRMKITLQRTNPAIFGAVVGRTGSTLVQSSVVRSAPSNTSTAVPAVLLLERSNCGSLQASGQGGVQMKGAGEYSGWIHTDTAAGGQGSIASNCQLPAQSLCSSNSNAQNTAILGTALPSSAGGGPSIVASDGSGGMAGTIGSYSLNPAVGGWSGCTYPAGLNHLATPDQLVSRTPVDVKYNFVANQNGMNITTLHATAYATTSAGAPLGATVVTGGACAQNDAVYTGTTIWVDCAGNKGFSGSNVVFRGQNVYFAGQLNVAGGYVAFPNAKRVWLRGCPSSEGGSCTAAINVASGGFLSINSGEQGRSPLLDAGTAPASWPTVDCITQRNGPASGGSTTNWTSVATFNGSLSVQNATANLCQSSIYLGDNTPTYVLHGVTTGGNCSVGLPCPPQNPPTGPVFNLNSGSQPRISWSAPSQSTTGPTPASPFDGLALWTEGGLSCSLAGQGAFAGTGVLFYPNCNFTYGGQADGNNALNAQFIGRSLNMSGQGLLVLQPDPRVSISVPAHGDIRLIR